MFSKQGVKSVHFTITLALLWAGQLFRCWVTLLPQVETYCVMVPAVLQCQSSRAASRSSDLPCCGDLSVSKYVMVSCTKPFKLKNSVSKYSLLLGSNQWFVNAFEIHFNKVITRGIWGNKVIKQKKRVFTQIRWASFLILHLHVLLSHPNCI